MQLVCRPRRLGPAPRTRTQTGARLGRASRSRLPRGQRSLDPEKVTWPLQPAKKLQPLTATVQQVFPEAQTGLNAA